MADRRTQMNTQGDSPPSNKTHVPSYAAIVWRRYTRSPLGVVALFMILIFICIAISAKFIANDRPFYLRVDKFVIDACETSERLRVDAVKWRDAWGAGASRITNAYVRQSYPFFSPKNMRTAKDTRVIAAELALTLSDAPAYFGTRDVFLDITSDTTFASNYVRFRATPTLIQGSNKVVWDITAPPYRTTGEVAIERAQSVRFVFPHAGAFGDVPKGITIDFLSLVGERTGWFVQGAAAHPMVTNEKREGEGALALGKNRGSHDARYRYEFAQFVNFKTNIISFTRAHADIAIEGSHLVTLDSEYGIVFEFAHEIERVQGEHAALWKRFPDSVRRLTVFHAYHAPVPTNAAWQQLTWNVARAPKMLYAEYRDAQGRTQTHTFKKGDELPAPITDTRFVSFVRVGWRTKEASHTIPLGGVRMDNVVLRGDEAKTFWFTMAIPYKELVSVHNMKEFVRKHKAHALFPPVAYSPYATSIERKNEPPSDTHLMGTDGVGRDVLARMIHGASVSLQVGLVATSISIILGLLFGALAGYFGGLVDMTVSRFIEIVICFPSFFLILAVMSALPASIVSIMVVIGLTSWTGIARLIRGEILRIKRMEYVEAAHVIGASDAAIIVKHILPNAITPVLIYASFGIASAILVETSLSFLGFGVPMPTASWGQIMEKVAEQPSYWWLLVFPGLAILYTVLGYNLIGEILRDALDPKSRI